MSSTIPLATACRQARLPLGVAARAIRCGRLFAVDGQVSTDALPELEALARAERSKKLRRNLARDGVKIGYEGSWIAAQ